MADTRSALSGNSPDVPLRHANRMHDHLPKTRSITQYGETDALSAHAASISSGDQCPCAVNDGSCETPETLAAGKDPKHSGWFRKDGTQVFYCELSLAKRGHKASLPLGQPPKGRPHRSMEHRLQKARMQDMVMGCSSPDNSVGNAGAAVQHLRCQEGLIGDGLPSLDDITVSHCNAASVALGISTVAPPELGASEFTCIGYGTSGPCLHADDSDSVEMHGGTCGIRPPHVGFNQENVVCKLVDEMFGAATRCMSPVEHPTSATPTPPVSTSCSSRQDMDLEEKETAAMHASLSKLLAESHHPEQQAEYFGVNHVLAHFRREARGHLRTRLPPLDLNIDCDTHKTIGEILGPPPEYMESTICSSRRFENLDSSEVCGVPAISRRCSALCKDQGMDQNAGEMLGPHAHDISPSAPAAAAAAATPAAPATARPISTQSSAWKEDNTEGATQAITEPCKSALTLEILSDAYLPEQQGQCRSNDLLAPCGLGAASTHVGTKTSKRNVQVDSIAFQKVNFAHECHLGLNGNHSPCKATDEMPRSTQCSWLRDSAATASTMIPTRSTMNSVRMNTWTSTGFSASWTGDGRVEDVFGMEERRATEPVISALQQNSLAGALRPGQQAPCHVGNRIMAPFQMTNRWYPGVVEEIHDDGQATIKWDDGDKKDRLKLIAQLQVFRPFTEFVLGQKVLARARDVGDLLQAKLAFGGGPWYLAIITSLNGDGTFKVEWVDRDKKGRTVRCDELWALSDDLSVATFNQVVRQPKKTSPAKDTQTCPFTRLLADAQRRERQQPRTTSQRQQQRTTSQRTTSQKQKQQQRTTR